MRDLMVLVGLHRRSVAGGEDIRPVPDLEPDLQLLGGEPAKLCDVEDPAQRVLHDAVEQRAWLGGEITNQVGRKGERTVERGAGLAADARERGDLDDDADDGAGTGRVTVHAAKHLLVPTISPGIAVCPGRVQAATAAAIARQYVVEADLQVGHLGAGERYVLDLVAEVDLSRLRALKADDPAEAKGVMGDSGPDFVYLVRDLWFRLEGTGRVVAASPR
jgi:hypothetical protein